MSRSPLPPLRLRTVLVVALGGALGSLARFGLARAFPHAPGDIPASTWVTNTTGALAIGVLVVVAGPWSVNRNLVPFVSAGFLGGYTTFSAYVVEVHTLLDAGQPGRALFYLCGTLATGLPAVWAGLALARQVAGRRSPPPPPRVEPEP